MDESSTSQQPKKRRSKKGRNFLIDIVTLFVIVSIAIIVFIIIGQSDSGSSTGGTTLNITGLHCEKSTTENPYFTKPTPESGKSEISANFNANDLTDFMITYTAVYPDTSVLEQAKTSAHAAFDLDLGNKYVHSDSAWSETFSILDDVRSVKMTVYSSASHLRSSTAHVFGLPKSATFPKTLSATRKAYEDQGYTCTVKQ